MCSGSKALWPHGVVKSNLLLAKVVYKVCLCPCLTFAQCICMEQPEVPIYKEYSLPHCLLRFILNPELLSGNTRVLGTQRLSSISQFSGWRYYLIRFSRKLVFSYDECYLCADAHWTMQPVRNEGWWAVRLHQSFEDTSKTFSSSYRGR